MIVRIRNSDFVVPPGLKYEAHESSRVLTTIRRLVVSLLKTFISVFTELASTKISFKQMDDVLWLEAMDSIKQILENLGVKSVKEMEVNENYTVEVDGYEDLTIEKIDEDEVSVAHHYVQRGDLMCDPEIVFRVKDGEWTPIEYTQHPSIYQKDAEGLDIGGFVDTWDRNLRDQGFVEASKDSV